MRSSSRALLCLGLMVLCALPVLAQQDHARVAVPLYRPADVMKGLYRGLLAPRAASFVQQAQALGPQVQALCTAPAGARASALEAVRAQWIQTLTAWETLAALPLGPMIERRALRQIDFQPTRPGLIANAIARRPAGAADMERIGTPAKGLPALEWLLWTRPVGPGTPACDYAQQLAADLVREAQSLQEAIQATAEREWDESAANDANAAFSELINQWVGAVERLRWAQIDKPRREAAGKGRGAPAAPAFARRASGQTAASWARQWRVLHELAVFQGGEVPQPGQGPVPLETYLRGRGLNPLADRWLSQVQRTQAAMQALRPGESPRLDAAVRALAGAKALAEGDVASALEVSIGFSDADGD